MRWFRQVLETLGVAIHAILVTVGREVVRSESVPGRSVIQLAGPQLKSSY